VPAPAIALVGADDGLDAAVDPAAAVVTATCLARDLVNTPAGDLKPADLADVAVREVTGEGLSVEVLDERAVAEMGLGGLLGVARGSEEPCRLIRMTYDPPGGSDTTVALVGKGITFDSGGLSLKTGEGMMTMKTDMGGGAAVIGTMSALPAIAPPVRVIAFVPTTENMPSGRAMRPGDVLTIRNGKTVEVLNTDAEGRLILADGLSLAVEEGARRDRRPRHPHRCLHGGARQGHRRPDDQRRRPRPAGARRRRPGGRAGVAAAAPAAVPQAPRLAHRRPEEHRQRPPRRRPDRRPVPPGVRRHHALGPPRHRRARRRARRTTDRS
jgi:hypothetical protein